MFILIGFLQLGKQALDLADPLIDLIQLATRQPDIIRSGGVVAQELYVPYELLAVLDDLSAQVVG